MSLEARICMPSGRPAPRIRNLDPWFANYDVLFRRLGWGTLYREYINNKELLQLGEILRVRLEAPPPLTPNSRPFGDGKYDTLYDTYNVSRETMAYLRDIAQCYGAMGCYLKPSW